MPRQRSEERTYIPQQIRHQVLTECGGVCAHCGTHLNIGHNFTLEHIIPLNKGGTNETQNFVALCYPCNKAKSDDIVSPSLYYPHLPKAKLVQAQTIFDDYMKNVRYLANDTLFPMDQFDTTFNMPMPTRNRRGKMLTIPMTAHITKMRPEAVIEYMLTYAARLDTFDKDLLPYREEDVLTPFYQISNKNKIVAVVSPYITKYPAATPIYPKDENRNILQLDVFFNPDANLSPQMLLFGASLLEHLVGIIFRSLKIHAEKTAIELMVKTPNSDNITNAVFKTILSFNGTSYAPYTLKQGENDGPRMSVLGANLFTGSFKEFSAIVDTVNKSEEKDKDAAYAKSMDKLRAKLDEELALSREVKTEAPKHKGLTKSQKKQKGKRTRKR